MRTIYLSKNKHIKLSMEDKQIERFSKSVLIRYISKLKKNQYIPLILITGQRRSGKSLTALAIALSLAFRKLFEFDIENNYIYDMKELIKKLLIETKNNVYIIDEAQDKLNSKEFWSDFSMAMEKIVATQTYLQNIFILIIPLGINLNKSLRRLTDIKIEMIKKRCFKWTIINKRYGEMGFTNRKAIWEYYIRNMQEVPKLDVEIIKKYAEIERKEKGSVIKDLAEKFEMYPKEFKKIYKTLEDGSIIQIQRQ